MKTALHSLIVISFLTTMQMHSFAYLEKCSDTLPPGYGIEKNQYGDYRAIHTDDGNRPLFELNDHLTRCEAIERAWSQYKYSKEQSEMKWKAER